MKRILLALAICMLSAPAWAVCGVTNLQVKDNAATTALVPYADDGSGGSNCIPQIQIKAGGNVAAVKAASTAAAQTDPAFVVRNPDIGTIGDAAWSSGNGTSIAIQKAIVNALLGALPAGSNSIGLVKIDQSTFGTTNGVVNAANTYNTVAASQSTQALTGGGGGATGDYLSHCVVTPGTTSPGVVTVLDNAVSVIAFAGGASSVSNLVPFSLPVGAKSVSGAWKITTGANVTVVCVGKFS